MEKGSGKCDCSSVHVERARRVQANAANIMADPGFESGIAGSYTGAIGDGWVVTAGTGAICNNSGAGCGNVGDAHTGVRMAFLDWNDSFNTITQALPTVIGQTYTISYRVTDPRVCALCVAGVKAKYRRDIFEDANYWADEPIEED
jgi:hypothetical protein